MIDGSSQGQTTINWPMAIAASVVLHVAILCPLLYFSGFFGDGPGASAPAKEQGAPTAGAAGPGTSGDNGGGLPSPGESIRSGLPGATTPDVPPVAATPSASAAAAASATAPGAATAADAATDEYVVKSGDNLTKIASRHGCTAAELARLNGFAIDKPLRIGETLKVPKKAE